MLVSRDVHNSWSMLIKLTLVDLKSEIDAYSEKHRDALRTLGESRLPQKAVLLRMSVEPPWTMTIELENHLSKENLFVYYLEKSVAALATAPQKVLVCAEFALGPHEALVFDTHDGLKV